MNERLRELFTRHLSRTLTPSEQLEFWGLVLHPKLKEELRHLALEAGVDWTQNETDMPLESQRKLIEQIEKEKDTGYETMADETRVVEMEPIDRTRGGWRRWVAAASILFLSGLGSYFLFFNNKKALPDRPIVLTTDVDPPKKTKAMITLADGRKVAIDSLTEIHDGAIQVVKNDNGDIVYDGTAREPMYNVLDNPRGSPVTNITLIDGTKIWLNAASSLRYFISNTGNERSVEIAGEAYFEVAKDASRPFIVKKGETEVKVLGTHFNVNAYDDEPATRITLLEGLVEVNGAVIRPGQQAIVAGMVEVVRPNISEVMAWKEGMFHFESADMRVVLREFSRWYDIDVVYEGSSSNEKYFVMVKRSSPLSSVLKALQASDMKFEIKGKTLTIKK